MLQEGERRVKEAANGDCTLNENEKNASRKAPKAFEDRSGGSEDAEVAKLHREWRVESRCVSTVPCENRYEVLLCTCARDCGQEEAELRGLQVSRARQQRDERTRR